VGIIFTSLSILSGPNTSRFPMSSNIRVSKSQQRQYSPVLYESHLAIQSYVRFPSRYEGGHPIRLVTKGCNFFIATMSEMGHLSTGNMHLETILKRIFAHFPPNPCLSSLKMSENKSRRPIDVSKLPIFICVWVWSCRQRIERTSSCLSLPRTVGIIFV
jgi:hypothetical protein